MRYVTLNGWGQLYDSLDLIIPSDAKDVRHIKYVDYLNYNELAASLKKEKLKCDVLIGWSLGGQLAVRLIEDKILKPKLLVLIAAPFQFVATKEVATGMSFITFTAFKNAFAFLPAATMHKFALMVAQGDSSLRKIVEELGIDTDNHANWLSWLEEIRTYSCQKLSFADFPRTLIVQGKGDTIVHMGQAKLFNSLIKNSKLEVFDFAGHAPHFHDPEKIKKLIKKELSAVKK